MPWVGKLRGFIYVEEGHHGTVKIKIIADHEITIYGDDMCSLMKCQVFRVLKGQVSLKFQRQVILTSVTTALFLAPSQVSFSLRLCHFLSTYNFSCVLNM